MIMKIDVNTARKAIADAFGSDINTSDMIVAESESNHEIKMYNDEVLFSVSIITAKRSLDDCARWIYSALCSDSTTGLVSWKYVHPITSAVYDDPAHVNYETLPFAA